MKIVNGIYSIFKAIIFLLVNPFEALTAKKETNNASEFMRKHFWIILGLSIIFTGVIMFVGYYDSIFKNLLGW